ncbi:MAG: homogentisate phytyltransferase [Pseudanabaenaceae cyanobacterium bins.39]|nr:homogentisate phytyltransferase [Pseudanabaenaceae cyanobacterium bins.39]
MAFAKSETKEVKMDWLRSLWAFARPHTIIGTSLSVFSLGIMAVVFTANVDLGKIWFGDGNTSGNVNLDILGVVLWSIVAALIPSICANVYIVGLNQLTDIEIDRINKPNLPLAAGKFSRSQGQTIVTVLGLAALLLTLMQGWFLFCTVGISMLIGTAYSLPPLRLKRFPFWAAMCIFGVRGVVVNLGFYLHFEHYFDRSLEQNFMLDAASSRDLNLLNLNFSSLWQNLPTIPPEIWALTAFVILFALAIALFKDIPDLDGDRQFQIRTLTVRLGTTYVFRLSMLVLSISYGLLIGLAILGILPHVETNLVIGTHLGLLAMTWWYGLRVDLQSKEQISQFYQFIWKLFFLEYLLFPIACIFGN